MQNFIFISPAFPGNYENFCVALKANGVNVLGIGDTPYDYLSARLKSALTEYYKVENMENYEEMFRAVAYLSFRHGKIDWLESNNEYWLEQDARLREDFHITTGLQPKDMAAIKYKSKMKAGYQKAGIPTARYHLVSDLDSALAFIREVGYPVIVKPDCGVGASDTWKISHEKDLQNFFCNLPAVPYIMEEFVPGEICSYDAIVNSRGTVLFETGNITPISIMDCVNDHDSIRFYIVDKLAEDLRASGRACIKAFHVRSRFVHLEFFRLTRNHPHLGRKGQIVGLEVNMRPSGGPTPDMINFAYSTNCYQHYADMVVYGSLKHKSRSTPCFCAFVGRWKELAYQHSHQEIIDTFRSRLKVAEELPDVLAHGMGNYIYLARLPEKKDMDEFFRFTLEPAKPVLPEKIQTKELTKNADKKPELVQ
ncbi:MAG: ATP-grasp domain-containing protein [Clostridiales bacterium]|nr:ATP-grasp domain-containing protein [Clostridiales bacterium]